MRVRRMCVWHVRMVRVMRVMAVAIAVAVAVAVAIAVAFSGIGALNCESGERRL